MKDRHWKGKENDGSAINKGEKAGGTQKDTLSCFRDVPKSSVLSSSSKSKMEIAAFAPTTTMAFVHAKHNAAAVASTTSHNRDSLVEVRSAASAMDATSSDTKLSSSEPSSRIPSVPVLAHPSSSMSLLEKYWSNDIGIFRRQGDDQFFIALKLTTDSGLEALLDIILSPDDVSNAGLLDAAWRSLGYTLRDQENSSVMERFVKAGGVAVAIKAVSVYREFSGAKYVLFELLRYGDGVLHSTFIRQGGLVALMKVAPYMDEERYSFLAVKESMQVVLGSSVDDDNLVQYAEKIEREFDDIRIRSTYDVSFLVFGYILSQQHGGDLAL